MSETITLAAIHEVLFNRTDDDDSLLRASAEAWETSIADRVEALQNVGRDIYIWGFTSDERYALVVDRDNDIVSVAHVNTVNSLGRWECNTAHLSDCTDIYWPRFPKR